MKEESTTRRRAKARTACGDSRWRATRVCDGGGGILNRARRRAHPPMHKAFALFQHDSPQPMWLPAHGAATVGVMKPLSCGFSDLLSGMAWRSATGCGALGGTEPSTTALVHGGAPTARRRGKASRGMRAAFLRAGSSYRPNRGGDDHIVARLGDDRHHPAIKRGGIYQGGVSFAACSIK